MKANRIGSLCLIAAKVLALLWTMTAPAAGQFRFFPPDEFSGPGLESPEPPPHEEAAEQHEADPAVAPIDRESGNAARPDAHAPDLRPLVRVYSDPRTCQPCRNFETWRTATADEAEPFRWQIETDPRRFPAWVTSVPMFVFRDSAGADRKVEGWGGIDWLVDSYTRNNPAYSRVPSPGVESPAVLPPASGDSPRGLSATIAELRRIAGDRGEFAVTFSKPINAEVQPGVTLRAASIKGHWDLSKTPPAVVFDAPQPEGTATIAGFWRVGYRLLGATVDDDKTVSVRTNWRVIKLTIEGGDQ